MAKPEFVCRRHQNIGYALGLAVGLLHDHKPFDSFLFGPAVGNIIGQIRRGHYVFTFEGDKLLGYAGWGWCDEKVARAWVTGQHNPSYEECLNGNVFIPMYTFAKTMAATKFQASYLHELARGHRGIWLRTYKDGRTRIRDQYFRKKDEKI